MYIYVNNMFIYIYIYRPKHSIYATFTYIYIEKYQKIECVGNMYIYMYILTATRNVSQS